MTDVVVELRALVDEDGDLPELWWYAEWGLDGSSSGSEHSTPTWPSWSAQ